MNNDDYFYSNDGDDKKIEALCPNDKNNSLKENACFFCRLSKAETNLSKLSEYNDYFNSFSIEKNNDFFKIHCPFCGDYTISKKIIEKTWNNPIIRIKLTSIAQERKLNREDGYTLVWNEKQAKQPEKAICEKGSKKIFLKDYPITNEEKNNRILINIYKTQKMQIAQDIPDIFNIKDIFGISFLPFEINPLQLGLFYLTESNNLYKYSWTTHSNNPSDNWRDYARKEIKDKIVEALNQLIDNQLMEKDTNGDYKITQFGCKQIYMLIQPNYKSVGNFMFHGIGQGLMYTGSISSYHINTCNTIINLPCPPTLNFIYDCGTKNEKAELNNAIDGLASHIDFIVISHLDDDHINGLERIKTKYTSNPEKQKIKVFLPYFDVNTYKDVFKMYLLTSGITENTKITKLLNIYETSIIITSSGNILQTDNEDRQNDDLFEYYLIKGDIKNPNEINQYITWNFFFYNLNLIDNKQIENDIVNLQNKIENKTISELTNLIASDDPIKSEYDSIFKNRNLTSLLLLHFPMKKPSIQTLLTGDVQFVQDIENTQTDQDKTLYKRIMKDLQKPYILQVPHHGAFNSWFSMPKDLWRQADKLVFSFGYPARIFNHPDIICFEDICNFDYPSDKLEFVYQGGEKVINSTIKIPIKPKSYEYIVG